MTAALEATAALAEALGEDGLRAAARRAAAALSASRGREADAVRRLRRASDDAGVTPSNVKILRKLADMVLVFQPGARGRGVLSDWEACMALSMEKPDLVERIGMEGDGADERIAAYVGRLKAAACASDAVAFEAEVDRLFADAAIDAAAQKAIVAEVTQAKPHLLSSATKRRNTLLRWRVAEANYQAIFQGASSSGTRF